MTTPPRRPLAPHVERLRARGLAPFLLAHMLVWSLAWGPVTALLFCAIGGHPFRPSTFAIFMLSGLGAGLTFGLWTWRRGASNDVG